MEIDDQKVLNVLLTSIEKNIKLRERASQCQLTQLQNFNITRGGFNTPGTKSAAIKNTEPNRPIFENNGTNNSQEDAEEYEDEDEYGEEINGQDN